MISRKLTVIGAALLLFPGFLPLFFSNQSGAAAHGPAAEEVPVSGTEYRRLFSLFPDIPGWKALEPEGSDLRYGDIRSITAKQSYQPEQENSELRLTAQIVIGKRIQQLWSSSYVPGYTLDSRNLFLEVFRFHQGEDTFPAMVQYVPGGKRSVLLLLAGGWEEGRKTGAVLQLDYRGQEPGKVREFLQFFDGKNLQMQYENFELE
ncbi:MAG: hypothetical protein K9L68_06715 [Spirochaetales bacterium]|nr:hypothetical protein [Spirochaetales bacterium]MCF7938276.1 hypothetical protein [Spirochaetales bacterium]